MYTNAQYLAYNGVNNGIVVDINGIPSSVPMDPMNSDYQNIMAAVAANTLTITPAAA